MTTVTTYNTTGSREDLINVIVNISPEETPMLSSFAKRKATNTLHEWLTDTLDTAGTNTVIEGSDATSSTPVQRTRLTNYCQINRKVPQVSDTLEAVTLAGVESEYEYQVAKRMAEIGRDMEYSIVNGVRNAGSAATARETDGVIRWLETNLTAGTGTGQALTETMYNNNLQLCFDQGGNPNYTYVNGYQKRQIAAMTSNLTRYEDAASGKLNSAINIYQSNFGLLRIILDRYVPATRVFNLQKDLWRVAQLRPVKHTVLAKDGSSRKGMIEAEWCLECGNEKASGMIYNLTPSAG